LYWCVLSIIIWPWVSKQSWSFAHTIQVKGRENTWDETIAACIVSRPVQQPGLSSRVLPTSRCICCSFFCARPQKTSPNYRSQGPSRRQCPCRGPSSAPPLPHPCRCKLPPRWGVRRASDGVPRWLKQRTYSRVRLLRRAASDAWYFMICYQ